MVKVGNTYGLSIDDEITSKRTGNYKVLSFEDKGMVRLQSLTCGNEVVVHRSNAKKGSIGNKMYPTVFGVGVLGYGKYKSRESTYAPKNKYYSVWENMLARCYYPKTSRYSAYGGKGVTVCDEWKNLQVFAEWFENNYAEGGHLDKDILGDGTEYNPDVCRFIPQEVNGLLVDNTCNTGKGSALPTGVSECRGGYQCTLNVEHTNGFRFNSDSISSVMKYYKKTKTEIVRRVVDKNKHLLTKDIYDKLSTYEFNYTTEEINEYF